MLVILYGSVISTFHLFTRETWTIPTNCASFPCTLFFVSIYIFSLYPGLFKLRSLFVFIHSTLFNYVYLCLCSCSAVFFLSFLSELWRRIICEKFNFSVRMSCNNATYFGDWKMIFESIMICSIKSVISRFFGIYYDTHSQYHSWYFTVKLGYNVAWML